MRAGGAGCHRETDVGYDSPDGVTMSTHNTPAPNPHEPLQVADSVAALGTRVLNASALDLPLPDESVDLIVTSPPYFALRSYRDGDEHYDGQVGSEATPQEFLESLWRATGEMKRVLKPTGSIWVNLGDKYAGSGGHNNSAISSKSTLTGGLRKLQDEESRHQPATRRDAPDRYNQNAGGIPAKSLMGLPWRYAIGCVDQLGLILRAEVVWSKPNGLPESVTDRVRRSHETWFHMVKRRDYFSSIDPIREAHAVPLHAPGNQKCAGERNDGDRVATVWGNPAGKTPGSVWTVATEPLTIPEAIQRHYNLPDHYAAFPTEWPRRIILGWSPVGGVVLDPFGGTGTVAMVARTLERVGISVDLSADYCRLAEWRIFQSGHGAKAEGRTWAERQGTMFEETA